MLYNNLSKDLMDHLRKIFTMVLCISFATPTLYANESPDTSVNTALYTSSMQGHPDEPLLLDPCLLFLQHLENQTLLDLGCGTGSLAILAAKKGATVYGIDLQADLIKSARAIAHEEGIYERLSFSVGNVNALPFPDHFFDKVISIDVAPNLPVLEPYIRELHRVLKQGGSALITTSHSFGTLFTEGVSSNIISRINCLLQLHSSHPSVALASLDELYRATFAWRNQQWTLITHESALIPGEEIWRKTPKMMVPNYYHPQKEYITLLQDHGFIIKHVLRPAFDSRDQLDAYNALHHTSLGTSYICHSPFIIFLVEKR